MLSLFPYVLSYGIFAPALLRFALVGVLGLAAWHHLEAPDARARFLGIAETVAAALLLAGLWTQAAALVAAIIAGIWFFFPTKTYAVSTIFLAFTIALSLILLGAGKIAFDLPF